MRPIPGRYAREKIEDRGAHPPRTRKKDDLGIAGNVFLHVLAGKLGGGEKSAPGETHVNGDCFALEEFGDGRRVGRQHGQPNR